MLLHLHIVHYHPLGFSTEPDTTVRMAKGAGDMQRKNTLLYFNSRTTRALHEAIFVLRPRLIHRALLDDSHSTLVSSTSLVRLPMGRIKLDFYHGECASYSPS